MSLEEAKNRIISQVPLEQFIGESVNLVRRSGRPVGLCPFHAEKSPSFYIYDDHYFCFGCRASGDAIDFVRQREGLGFREALQFLAKKYGIPAPELEQTQSSPEHERERSLHYKAMLLAQEFFTHNLFQPAGAEALEYVRRRGFSLDNVKTFGFGFALDSFHALCDTLRRRGIPEQTLVDLSLAGKSRKTGKAFDFFRNRLMIPIQDTQGRIIAFGGRIIREHRDEPKYKNSREGKLFEKSKVLFGLQRARPFMKQNRRAIVVEGYMDALQLWQNGFDESVACLGTALTSDHLRILKQTTQEVVLLFDGDSAGKKASLQTVKSALDNPELHIRVAILPAGEDPDTYLKNHTKEELNRLIDNSSELFEFAILQRFQSVADSAVPTLIRKELIPWLDKLNDPIQRSFLLNRISTLSGVPLELIERQVSPRTPAPKREKPSAPTARNIATPKPSESSLGVIAYELLGHLYFANRSDQIQKSTVEEALSHLALDTRWEEFALTLHARDHEELKEEQWNDEQIQSLVHRFTFAAGAFVAENRQRLLERLTLTARHRKLRDHYGQLKRTLARMGDQINDETLEVLRAISNLDNDLKELENNLRAE